MKVSGVVDSGAVTTVTHPDTVPWLPSKETASSRRGQYFTNASGNKVFDEGQKLYEGFSDAGAPITIPATSAKVARTLLSVKDMAGANNIVSFGLDEDHAIINIRTGKTLAKGGKNIIVNKGSGSRTDIIDNGRDYIMNIWMKKPKNNLEHISYNNVGHGLWKKTVETRNSFRVLGSDEVYSTF